MNPAYQITYVKDPRRLAALGQTPGSAPAIALDIETASRWDPRDVRDVLVPLAYRDARRVRGDSCSGREEAQGEPGGPGGGVRAEAW